MKKRILTAYLIILVCLSFQFFLICGMAQGELTFVNSYWNTTGIGNNPALEDWNEAGKVGFAILTYTGNLYVKNDFSNMFLGVLIRGKSTEDLIWRINFDIDSDNVWAEDAKELTVLSISDSVDFSYDDQFYLMNNPQPYSDSQTDNFEASFREFTLFGEQYSIIELTIPLQSDDLLNDLQIANPEGTIIGLSLDVYNIQTSANGTWKGGTYPNYAESSNYGQILFAGPQDRQVPEFVVEPPITTTTTAEETEYPGAREGAAASGFEAWIFIISVSIISLVLSRRRKH